MDFHIQSLLLVLLLQGVAIHADVFEDEVSCLRLIKASLEDPHDKLISWNFDKVNHPSDLCWFSGVGCWNVEGSVMEVAISNMELQGPFPRGVANCTHLTRLDLSRNNLYGPLPSDLPSLIGYVTDLDLSGNDFSGEIPSSLANCNYLNYVRLDDNHFRGEIPPELGSHSRIKGFLVANNNLTGPVPEFVNVIMPAANYANNTGLCGSPLPPCTSASSNEKGIDKAKFISGFVVGFAVSALGSLLLGLFCIPNFCSSFFV